MEWETIIFYLVAGGSLLFWPIHQLLIRRWTARSKRLFAVFLGTGAVLLGYVSLLWGPWRANESAGSIFWMAIINLISFTISIILCLASPEQPLHGILRWGFVLLFTLLLIHAGYIRFILDWSGQPVCHKVLMTSIEIWTEDHETNAFPNINGEGHDSLAELREAYPNADLANRYSYVAGLHKDDPGDLVLMYVKQPTRWIWHGRPNSIFNKKAWIVVPVDFAIGKSSERVTQVTSAGECSETLSNVDFGARLQRTLDYLRTNSRPNWQTVLAEHTKALESLNR